MKLISGAECVRRLRQAGVFKGKESYFSQLVQKGIIPYHNKAASPKKWYVLDEVKKALKEWEDPTRDAQREANEAKRRALQSVDDKVGQVEQAIYTKLQTFKDIKELKKDDYNLEDLEDISEDEFEQELREVNHDNLLITEMANDFIRHLQDRSDAKVGWIVPAYEALEFFEEWIMQDDSIKSFYGVVKKSE